LSVFNTLFETTVQEQVSPGALSRVASIDWLLSLGLFPVGFAVAGPAAAVFGVRVPLLAGAVWILLSTAIVLAVPSVRQVRRLDTASAGSNEDRQAAEAPAGTPSPVPGSRSPNEAV
jgi:hypothetical protein